MMREERIKVSDIVLLDTLNLFPLPFLKRIQEFLRISTHAEGAWLGLMNYGDQSSYLCLLRGIEIEEALVRNLTILARSAGLKQYPLDFMIYSDKTKVFLKSMLLIYDSSIHVDIYEFTSQDEHEIKELLIKYPDITEAWYGVKNNQELLILMGDKIANEWIVKIDEALRLRYQVYDYEKMDRNILSGLMLVYEQIENWSDFFVY